MQLMRLGLLLAISGLAACGGKPQVQGNPSTRVNVLGEEESSSGISVSLEDDTPEARLKQAARVQTDGDFPTAITLYQALTSDSANPPEIREEALYRLGSAYAHPLNNHRDYASAVHRLEQLLTEFPETSHRSDAEANLERYRALLAP